MSYPSTQSALVWLRKDLRVSDNPALLAASQSGLPVNCLFILEQSGSRALGGAARWWLHHALASLAADLRALGGALTLLRGDPEVLVPFVAQQTGASHVFWNRRYDPKAIEVDTSIKSMLGEAGCLVESFNANLLYEPWEVKTKTGGAYKVFTPFWRAAQASGPGAAVAAPVGSLTGGGATVEGEALSDWALLPTKPNWASGFAPLWSPGEAGARKALNVFLDQNLDGYAQGRDFPARQHVSRLSPHLRFGEISPRQIRDAVNARFPNGLSKDASKFMAEIGWREFSHLQLFIAEDIKSINWNRSFDGFPWADNPAWFAAWSRGQTGYPLVDAGMRELWQTGWMHNRVRMVVASFLIKHLQIDWRDGEDWFWDTLVDADPAANPASWQWVAGCGADAAPYFRIFNPILQSKKFDKDGTYIRRFVPEIAALPDKYLHAPWEAPADILGQAGIRLGETYPAPIVDHATARAAALDAYKGLSRSEEP